MTVKEYQSLCASFGEYAHPAYLPLGFNEEVGEFTGKVAKKIRKEGIDAWLGGDNEYKDGLRKELGDCAWFLAELCTVLGFDLEAVMIENIAKLQSRQARGVICGEGDNR